MNRSTFLKRSLLSSTVLLAPSWANADQDKEKPAPLKLEIVKEFVSVSHGKFTRMKEMLDAKETRIDFYAKA